jgi:phosphatidylglycerophosphate synthase
MSRPTIDQVRAEGQPRWVVERVNDEHLFGRLYMRKLSPRVTWLLARLGISPNTVTVLFVVCGVAAGVVVAFGGLATAIIAAVLVQAGLLFDCADGELARLTKRDNSVRGIYLDRIGHYLCDAAMIVGLGLRAQGHLTTSGRYVTAGLFAALLALLVKTETDNVIVSRAAAGLAGSHDNEALQPRSAGLASLRRAASVLKIHRIIQSIELSVLILIAAIIDAARGGLTATRVVLIACLIVAALMVVAHLAAILASRRLS